MSKLTDAVTAETRRAGGTCPIRKALTALDKASAADLQALLTDRTVFGATIGRGLTKLGHKTSGEAVQSHRNGECACDKAAG